MSEEFDYVVEAIRKIARTDPKIKTALDAAAQRAPIPAVRGIAYLNSDGGISSSQGNLPDDADTTGEEEESGTPTLKRDSDIPVINDDLQPGDQADIFKGFDCATGEEITLDLSPIPGQEYPAPDGWEDANSPPIDPTYVQGRYWRYSTYSGGKFPTERQALNAYIPTAEAGTHPINSPSVYSWDGDWYHYDSYSNIHAWKRTYSHKSNPNYGGAVLAQILRYGCGDSTESYCNPAPEDLLLETEWPSNSTTELALIDGKFQASEYDPDAADIYKNNAPSSIEVCDGDGNRYRLENGINNSIVLTGINNDGSIPDDGETVVIDQSGRVTNRVHNIFRDNYLP